jgi:hypothetical protein
MQSMTGTMRACTGDAQKACVFHVHQRSLAWTFLTQVFAMSLLLLILIVLLLVGVIPVWPHSRSWGYRPTGGLGLVLIIVIVLLLMHVI